MAQTTIICDECGKMFTYTYNKDIYRKLKESGKVVRISCPYCHQQNIVAVSVLAEGFSGEKAGVTALHSTMEAVGAFNYFVATAILVFTDLRYLPLVVMILISTIIAIAHPIFFFIPVVLLVVLGFMVRTSGV